MLISERQAVERLRAGGGPTASGDHLELRDPGSWFDHVLEHRLLTGRDRPWALLGWQGFSPRLGTVGN